MNPDAPVVVRVLRRFPGSPERVFDAWLDPRTAARFLYATQNGRMQRFEIDARVGGGYTAIETRVDGDAAHFGRYLEIERPRRLVFTLSPDPAEPGDRITLELVPAGGGGELSLTHEMAAEHAPCAQRTEAGWQHIPASLAGLLALVPTDPEPT